MLDFQAIVIGLYKLLYFRVGNGFNLYERSNRERITIVLAVSNIAYTMSNKSLKCLSIS